MLSSPRVLLLRDASWPVLPGICCWRPVEAAFTAAGAAVDQLDSQPARHPPGAPPAATAGHAPRAAWLPGLARRPLAAAYRGTRGVAAELAGMPTRLATRRYLRTEVDSRLAGAALVLAESPAAATLAARRGVPPNRLWLLALPRRRLFAGEIGGYAAELAEVSPLVGGFLVNDDEARDSVEDIAAHRRPRVEVFPSVVNCHDCTSSAEPVGAPVRQRAAAVRVPGWPELAAGPDWDHGAPQLPPSPRHAPDESGPTAAAARLRVARAILATVPAGPPRPSSRKARSVLLSGYDLKFADELAGQLDRRDDLAVTVDEWPDLGRPGAETAVRLRTADTIFAEWARTSAVWLSQRVRPDQVLVVRLHRFELDSRYPADIAIDNVDAVVYIAPLFGRRIREELGWPEDKLVYIPNYHDLHWLDRPKLPEARFALGFVGMEWSRKRFDLALDLLVRVRREDPRFRLVVRSADPWRNEFAWSDASERDFTARCFDRIEREPLLRDAVIFHPPGRDMARWYRRVGHLLSTSDEEGSHASVAEAMASGAVPVIRAWPGADELYDERWVHASMDRAVAAVLGGADATTWERRAQRAKAEIRRTHDPEGVVRAWVDLLHGDLRAARGRFAARPASQSSRAGVGR